MAENKEGIKLVQFGDEFYKLDDLLKLHTQQEQNFYKFAKERGQFDDYALERLREAINNKINAAKSGKVFEADGGTDTDVVDNVSIQTYKGKGKKRKGITVKQGMKDWADYYISTLSSNLPVYNKTQTGKTWDLAKHGFGAYLLGQGLAAQDVFEQYDTKDPDNADAPRSMTERRELLKKHLLNYKQWLSKQGFDYSQNENDWDDSYETDLDRFITDYTANENYDVKDITQALRRLGAGHAFTTAFTSDKWDGSLLAGSDQQTATSGQPSQDEINRYNAYIRGEYDNNFLGQKDLNLGGVTYFTTKGDRKFEMSDEEWEEWKKTHTNDSDSYMDQLQQNYYTNPFDPEVAAEWLPLLDRAGRTKEVTIDGKAYKYDPGTIDRNKLRFVAFDPVTGEIRHAFLGDIEEEKEAMRRKWRIANGYAHESDKYTVTAKDGGVISMQYGGDFSLKDWVNSELEKETAARAKENNNTVEVQKARDRTAGIVGIAPAENTIKDQNAKFSAAEYARLGSIAADITSIILDPVSGVAVGLGSSLANFGADMMDDGIDWGDVKNFGINVGFDLLGAIPIIGDAVGTGSKVARNVIKWVPRLMALVAAKQGVQNWDGMMESLSKFKSIEDAKTLTVQDWRNIAQSISLAMGGIRGVKNKVQQVQTKKAAKVEGALGITIIDKSNPNSPVTKQILVDGDVAKKIRQSDGSKAQVEAELSKLDVFKDKFGENGTFEVSTKNNGERQIPFHRKEQGGEKSWEWRGWRKEGKGQISDVYDFDIVTGRQVNGIFSPIKKIRQKLNDKHLGWIRKYSKGQYDDYRGAKTVDQAIDAEIANLKQALLDQAGKVKSSMDNRATRVGEVEQALVPERARLEELKQKLNGVADEATLKTNESSASKVNEKAKTSVQKLNDAITDLEKQITSVRNAPLSSKDPKGYQRKQEISDLQRKLDNLRNQHRVEQQAQQLHQKALDDIQAQLKDRSDLSKAESEIQRLEKILPQLQRTNHTNAYKKLQAMIQDYRQRYSNIRGRQVTWDDTNKVLADAGITDAFKHGGSVNRNKLNKFINYAKG